MKWFSKAQPEEAKSEQPSAESPSGGKNGPRRKKRVWLRWLHVAAVLATLVVLTFLNQAWGLDRLLESRLHGLHAFWLPLLFLLIYALCWLSWWAIRQLGPDQLTGEFPELERAWAGARQALDDQGIDLRATPLFLVLGQPESGMELFFSASHWPFQVRFSSSDPQARIHVCANREAVFLACPDESLLAAFATAGATAEPVLEPAVADARPAGAEGDRDESPKACLLCDPEAPQPCAPPRATPIRDRRLVEDRQARLAYLCRIVAEERQPYVPINGVLTLFPLSATDSPERAREAGTACRMDLQAVRESLGVECPHLAMLCDFERVPGFDELLAAFPDRPSQQWVLGRTFPLVPDIDSNRWSSMIEQGVQWLADSQWPSMIYPIMQNAAMPNQGQGAESNQRCFHLLEEGRRRLRMVPELLVRGFQETPPARALFAGFALAGTGVDSLRQQGFVAGVLRWLVEAQDHVAWTGEALREDATCRFWTRLGFYGLAAFLGLLGVLSVGLLT